MSKRSYWSIVISYWLLVLGLFFYSFTQIDLNLTLSKIEFYQTVQKFLTQIGYFNRPLSTAIFLFLIFLFFIFYFLFLWLVVKKKLSEKQILWLIILTVIILLPSYPAFSHDIFNYMFDARILTNYHLNPYNYKALDFPSDPWIRFMHWTHRTYPYGPMWLPISLVPSFLGFQKFILTLFNFKLLAALSFLGNIFLIGKIMEKINPSKKLLAITFFAFNPLVIVESLVSAHNEIVMMFLAVLAIYLLVIKKNLLSFSTLLLSVGIKYATISLLPVILYVIFFKKNERKINWPKIFLTSAIFMATSLVLVLTKIEIQPWYFLWVIPFVALNPEKILTFTTVGLSLGLLLRYAPFLYYGHWDPPVLTIKLWLTIIPLILLSFTVYFLRK